MSKELTKKNVTVGELLELAGVEIPLGYQVSVLITRFVCLPETLYLDNQGSWYGSAGVAETHATTWLPAIREHSMIQAAYDALPEGNE